MTGDGGEGECDVLPTKHPALFTLSTLRKRRGLDTSTHYPPHRRMPPATSTHRPKNGTQSCPYLHLGHHVDHLLRRGRQASRIELPIRPEPLAVGRELRHLLEALPERKVVPDRVLVEARCQYRVEKVGRGPSGWERETWRRVSGMAGKLRCGAGLSPLLLVTAACKTAAAVPTG